MVRRFYKNSRRPHLIAKWSTDKQWSVGCICTHRCCKGNFETMGHWARSFDAHFNSYATLNICELQYWQMAPGPQKSRKFSSRIIWAHMVHTSVKHYRPASPKMPTSTMGGLSLHNWSRLLPVWWTEYVGNIRSSRPCISKIFSPPLQYLVPLVYQYWATKGL